MNIVFAGKGDRAQVCLDYLVKHGYNPVLLIGTFNRSHKIKTYQTKNINSDKSIKYLKKFNPDLLILASFTQILKKPIINLSKKGTINLHGGQLPQYRGASVLNWQIINGEPQIGISIIFVDEGIDTGDIILQRQFALKQTDTIKEVVNKTLKLFPKMLLQAIKDIEAGTVRREKQNLSEGKLYKKRRPEDGEIDQNWPDWKKYNFVRALARPYPGAFYIKNGKKIMVWKMKLPELPQPDRVKLKPVKR